MKTVKKTLKQLPKNPKHHKTQPKTNEGLSLSHLGFISGLFQIKSITVLKTGTKSITTKHIPNQNPGYPNIKKKKIHSEISKKSLNQKMSAKTPTGKS